MISFDEARAIIADIIARPCIETIALAEAHGRIAAQDLLAYADSPAMPLSAMDGYAVISTGAAKGAQMHVVGESLPSLPYQQHAPLREDQAVRVFTGAALPKGTDRVIMQEHVSRNASSNGSRDASSDASSDGDFIQFARGYESYYESNATHIRAIGSDFRKGTVLVSTGSRLNARAMVAAAAADLAEIAVYAQPRLTIIATGDELAAPGSARLHAHAIPESVSYGVAAMAQEHSADIIQRMQGADNIKELTTLAETALAQSDLIVITGGASVGAHDYARDMFAAHGLELLINKVSIKPGKPVWLGRCGEVYVLGLPGNPTSAMVTARLFMVSLLARLSGQISPSPLEWQSLPLAAPIAATGERETFLRAAWVEGVEGGLAVLDNQESGAQAALTKADWLIRCRARQKARAAGDIVQSLPF